MRTVELYRCLNNYHVKKERLEKAQKELAYTMGAPTWVRLDEEKLTKLIHEVKEANAQFQDLFHDYELDAKLEYWRLMARAQNEMTRMILERGTDYRPYRSAREVF